MLEKTHLKPSKMKEILDYKNKILKKNYHLRQLYKMNTKFENIINKYQRYNR